MRRILIFTLFASLLYSCQDAKIDEAVNNIQPKEYIHATISKDDTRVELNNHKQTVWTEGDMIIRFGDNIHDVWMFEGKTGDRGGKFSKYASFNNTVNHAFGGKYLALYPYRDGLYYGTGSFTNGDMAMFYKVFAEQNYHPNSYDTLSNIMLGVGKDAENFTFQNVMGYLRLSLTGSKKVKSIVLEGNKDEILAGVRYIHQEDVYVGDWYKEPSYTMTLNCGDGVQLTGTPTEFYFALIPRLFENGITATINFTDGSNYVKSTRKSVSIVRNIIQPMATISTDEAIEWQRVIIKHHGDRVAAPYLLGNTSVLGYIYWGDGYQSDVNTIDAYNYADSDGEHEIVIETLDANYIYIESCAGISEIDLTNF